jgi:hypothetical protein
MCDKQSLPLASSNMGQQTRFHVLQVKGVRVSSRTCTTDGNQIGAAGAESSRSAGAVRSASLPQSQRLTHSRP